MRDQTDENHAGLQPQTQIRGMPDEPLPEDETLWEDGEYEEYDDEEEKLEDRQAALADLKGQYLSFWLAEQRYGMCIATVEQIVGVPEIIHVPGYPAYAQGVINLRGSNIPVVDLRLYFHKPKIPYTDRTCIVIHQIGDIRVGLIVDRVDAVTSIADEEIMPPPYDQEHAVRSCVTGIVKENNLHTMLLDLYKIFKDSELAAFKAAQRPAGGK